MVENFSGNNDSSIFVGKVRLEDLAAEQKLNELKGVADEIAKKIALKKVELEHEACGHVDAMFSQVELHIEEGDEDYFNGERERVLGDFWSLFESLFNLFEVDVDDPKIYQMLKEKKEKNWLLSIIKFLRDKLKELIKKIFARDLSFNQRLDKEIKELQEKLNSGGLSPEEEMAILERLEALRGLKFRLQLAVTGWIITMFAEMFGVELAAAVEASTEETAKAEDKKAEKTSLKEENKEVCENVEIKVDEREKPKVPVSLFIEVSPGFVRPVVLSKPELDLLPEPLKIPMDLSHKEVISNEGSKVQKPKVNEAKPGEPKVAVCPPAPKTAMNATGTGQRRQDVQGCNSGWGSDRNSSTYVSTPNQPTPGSVVLNKDASEQSAENPVPNGKALERSNQASGSAIEKSASNIGAKKQSVERLDFTVGFWNGAENEGSVSNAQPPKGLTNDVKVEKCVEGQSVGKTP